MKTDAEHAQMELLRAEHHAQLAIDALQRIVDHGKGEPDPKSYGTPVRQVAYDTMPQLLAMQIAHGRIQRRIRKLAKEELGLAKALEILGDEGGSPMSEILRYLLVAADNIEQDYEYDDYEAAVVNATMQRCAIFERHYVLSSRSLIWIPGGVVGQPINWPPPTPEPAAPWPRLRLVR